MTGIIGTPHSLGSAIQDLRRKWGWIVALGVVFVITGGIALGSVVLATAVSVVYVGFMMLLAGVAEIFSAFQMKTWGKFFLWIILGLLYALAGFFAFENPLLVAGALTLSPAGSCAFISPSRCRRARDGAGSRSPASSRPSLAL